MHNEKKMVDVVNDIRQTGYQIHVYFGVGYLEKVYENALVHRLRNLDIMFHSRSR